MRTLLSLALIAGILVFASPSSAQGTSGQIQLGEGKAAGQGSLDRPSGTRKANKSAHKKQKGKKARPDSASDGDPDTAAHVDPCRLHPEAPGCPQGG